MKRLSVCFLMSMLVWGGGCTTNPSIQNLSDAQKDTDALLWQQAEEIKLQAVRLEQLEVAKAQLEESLSLIRQELQAARESEKPPAPLPPKTGWAKKVITQKPGASVDSKHSSSGKIVLGRTEWVWFDLFRQSVPASIDNSQKSSQLYVTNSQFFERDGEQWVRFGMPEDILEGGATDKDAKVREFEVAIVKKVKVKRNQSDEFEKRAIVSLRIKVGDLVDDTHFILSDGGDGDSGIVLGRTFLRDIAEVDMAKKFVQIKIKE